MKRERSKKKYPTTQKTPNPTLLQACSLREQVFFLQYLCVFESVKCCAETLGPARIGGSGAFRAVRRGAPLLSTSRTRAGIAGPALCKMVGLCFSSALCSYNSGAARVGVRGAGGSQAGWFLEWWSSRERGW